MPGAISVINPLFFSVFDNSRLSEKTSLNEKDGRTFQSKADAVSVNNTKYTNKKLNIIFV
jgi:hypothetical protein